MEPATGDFVFGVSEGYLIEDGKVTRPCRGATLIGNCLQALARIDAVGSDFEMKTGFCGKAGQTAPVGTGQGHVRIRGHDGRRDGGMSEGGLEDLARRAAEAATAAGASDAEAWAEGSRSREVRVHAGEVESLTEASGAASAIRAWIGARTGYAYGTDLSDAGLAELAEAAVGAARVADEDENSAAPEPSGDAAEIPGLRDEGVASTETAEVIELAKRIERAALDRDERVTGVEEVVYVDEDSTAAIATSRGVSGAFGASVAYSFLQAMATEDSEVQTGLGFGVARSPRDLDAGRDRRRGRGRGELDARRHQAGVAHLSGGALGPGRRQLRRLHRRSALRGRGPARTLAVRRPARGARSPRRRCESPTTASTRADSPARPSTARGRREAGPRCSETASCSPICTTATRPAAAARPPRATPPEPPTARRRP